MAYAGLDVQTHAATIAEPGQVFPAADQHRPRYTVSFYVVAMKTSSLSIRSSSTGEM